jgi:hypothetical protein
MIPQFGLQDLAVIVLRQGVSEPVILGALETRDMV